MSINSKGNTNINVIDLEFWDIEKIKYEFPEN
jgi:hypothetical protein